MPKIKVLSVKNNEVEMHNAKVFFILVSRFGGPDRAHLAFTMVKASSFLLLDHL